MDCPAHLSVSRQHSLDLFVLTGSSLIIERGSVSNPFEPWDWD